MLQHRYTTIGVEQRRLGSDYLPRWASTCVETPLRWSFINIVRNVNSDLRCVALRTNGFPLYVKDMSRHVTPMYHPIMALTSQPQCHYVALRTEGSWSHQQLYTLFADDRDAQRYKDRAPSRSHRLRGKCSSAAGELWNSFEARESHASGVHPDSDHLPRAAVAHRRHRSNSNVHRAPEVRDRTRRGVLRVHRDNARDHLGAPQARVRTESGERLRDPRGPRLL